jgi:hypothetical protein
VKKRFVIVNFAPGAKKEKIIQRPIHISDGFSFFENTPFENVIDCAFDTDGNQAFIFSGNQCAKIDYAPDSEDATLLEGPVPITTMFPCLKETVFVNGVDAAIRAYGNMVFLFKGDEYARIDYQAKTLMVNRYIRNGFRSLVGTVYENGIDAAFASSVQDQAYVFKGEYVACIDISNKDFIVNGRINRTHEGWPALHGILKN